MRKFTYVDVNDNNVEKEVTELKITESFTNHFAENVLKLEDGTTLYISYGQTEVRVVKPINNTK